MKSSVPMQSTLGESIDAWGIKVISVELKHVDWDEGMIRAIARQAEAEREYRAKVINADEDIRALTTLFQAVTILSEQPQSIQ